MSEPAPLFRVVRGRPSAEETAALTVVLVAARAARASAARTAPAKPASAWADRSRLLRSPVRPSPGGWRRSALPS